jgi:hypothetical protein
MQITVYNCFKKFLDMVKGIKDDMYLL